MSLWDKIKDMVPKLVDIKNQLLKQGRLYLFSQHIEVHEGLKPEDVEKITRAAVTEQMEMEYQRQFRRFIESREAHLESLPEPQMQRELAVASTGTAAQVVTIAVHDRAKMRDVVDVEVTPSSLDSETVIADTHSTGPPKKPWPSDEGETM